MEKRPNVALLIESSRVYGRDLIKGISDYAKWNGPWSFYWAERRIGDPMPSWLEGWKGDGIIARVESQEFYNKIKKLNVPIVDVYGHHSFDDVPLIDADDKKVSEMAAQHLLNKGFRELAYCGIEDAHFSDARLKNFNKYVEEANLNCHVYSGTTRFGPHDLIHSKEQFGVVCKDELAKWIADLPKPLGIFVCNDVVAQLIVNVCRENNILVPEQVSVVGVDNDDAICELSSPTLSSVKLDTVRIGYESAAMLNEMMKENNSSLHANKKIYIPPLKVIQRQSTDVMAVDDYQVCQALKIIRERACEGINVSDVVDKISISRRSLERRFEKHVKRSLNKEITRVQIEKVKELLTETHYDLSQISKLAGFDHPEYMQVVFKKQTSESPGRYRKMMTGERN